MNTSIKEIKHPAAQALLETKAKYTEQHGCEPLYVTMHPHTHAGMVHSLQQYEGVSFDDANTVFGMQVKLCGLTPKNHFVCTELEM